VTFTVRDNRNVLGDVFKAKLGEGKPYRDKTGRFGIYFQNRGIYLASIGAFGWRNIQLEGNTENLALLAIVSQQTEFRFKLKLIEIAFDVCPPMDTHYIIQNRIANRLYPKHGADVRFILERGEEQPLQSGEINGEVTSYIYAIDKKQYKEKNIQISGKNIGSQAKVYCKNIDSKWCCRVEITLHKPFFKTWPLPVPIQYPRLAKLLPTFKIDDFYAFYDLDYVSFTDAVRQYCSKTGHRFPRALLATGRGLLISERGRASVERIRFMRQVARDIKAQNLYNSIIRRFTRSMTFAEACSTPLPDEADPPFNKV